MVLKYILIALTLFIGKATNAQLSKSLDYDAMCSIMNDKSVNSDSINFNRVLTEIVYPFYANKSEKELKVILNESINIFSKKCLKFKNYLIQIEKNNPSNNYELLEYLPKAAINKIDIAEFKKQTRFYYLNDEVDGDTIEVIIENNLWKEYFVDNSYSILEQNWNDDLQFDLIFRGTTNAFRKEDLYNGQKFSYQILSKSKNFYYLILKNENLNIYYKFKLYFKET